MADVGSIVKNHTGVCYKLSRQLGKGGEGTVFEIENTSLVAKIYHKPDVKMEKKLLCMLKYPLNPKADGVHLLIAWPQDVLYENNAFIGYTMPRISDTYPIYTVARNNGGKGTDCYTVFPHYDWRYSLMVAYHLAWTVNYIHEHNYVIGDMNPNNIVIHGDGSLTILDVDSFDIVNPDTGERFPCNVGVSEFLAPELQGRDLRRANFTKHTDEFALAIHIFILLMNNTHPFNLRSLSTGEFSSNNVKNLCHEKRSIVQDQKMVNIVHGYCPFVKNIEGYDIPLQAPRITMLPRVIQTAFRTTFGYNESTMMTYIEKRVSANMWRAMLYQYFQRSKGINADLVRCSVNREHFYLRSRGSCEFCAAKQRYETALSTNSTQQTNISSFSHFSSNQIGTSWEIKIVCVNTDATDMKTNQHTFYKGDKVYSHFQVSSGPLKLKTQFYFRWISPDKSVSSLQPLNSTMQVHDSSYVCVEMVSEGTHIIEYWDNSHKLAESKFEVLPPKKTKNGFWKFWG